MGRPVSKKYFGNKAGAVLLNEYRARTPGIPGSDPPPQKGGQSMAGETQYMVEQKSTNRFKVSTAAGTPPESTRPSHLVAAAGTTFDGQKSYGEFNVDGYKDDGTKVFIEKFFNRVVIYLDGGVRKKAPWIKNDNLVTVDSQNSSQTISIVVSSTGTDNIAITAPAAFVANLNVGDTIVIFGSTQTALNGDHVVAAKSSTTEFTVETDSTDGGTAGTVTSGTLMKKIPGAIIFDYKNAAT